MERVIIETVSFESLFRHQLPFLSGSCKIFTHPAIFNALSNEMRHLIFGISRLLRFVTDTNPMESNEAIWEQRMSGSRNRSQINTKRNWNDMKKMVVKPEKQRKTHHTFDVEPTIGRLVQLKQCLVDADDPLNFCCFRTEFLCQSVFFHARLLFFGSFVSSVILKMSSMTQRTVNSWNCFWQIKNKNSCSGRTRIRLLAQSTFEEQHDG